MKNKIYNKLAFTLMELLAVIVIISIIVIIAVPIVLGIIERSEREAFTISVNNILRQLKYEKAAEILPPTGVGQNGDVSYTWIVPNNTICLTANNRKYEIVNMNCTDAEVVEYGEGDRLRITNVSGNPTVYTNQDVVLIVTAAGGVPPYQYSFDNGVTYQESNQISISNNTELYINVKDSIGTILDTSYQVVIDKIDKEIPTISLLSSYIEIFQNDAINLNDYVTANDNVGIKQTIITGSLSNIIVGTYIINYQAEDLAGNLSEIANLTIRVKDRTLPTMSLSNTSTDWYNTNVTIDVTMTDNDGGAGIEGYIYCIKTDGTDCLDTDYSDIQTNNQIIVSDEGYIKLSVKAKDIEGNYSLPATKDIKIDKTKPTISVNGTNLPTSIDHEAGTSFTIPAGIATDLLSGITGTVVTTGTVSTIVGTYTITYSIYDNAGNLGEYILTVNVVDTSAPAITLTPNSPNGYGWYTNDINILVTAADNDNIDNCGYKVSTDGGTSYPGTWIDIPNIDNTNPKTIVITEESANLKVLVRCTDRGGIFNEKGTAILKQDKTIPGCVSSGGDAGWTNGNKTLTGTCSDGMSGCYSNVTKSYTTEINSTTESPGSVRDNAGNTTTCPANQTVRIDKTAPSVPSVNLNGYTSGTWTNQNVTTTLSASDALSGLSGYQYSHDASGWTAWPSNPWTINWDGEWNFYTRSIDNAGNVSTSAPVYTIRRDSAPPTFSYFYIGGTNNPNSVTSTSTTLYFSVSGATQMCISTTTSCSAWEGYSTSKAYTLSAGYGTKTLYAWFRDTALNQIGYYSDSIEYLQGSHSSTYICNASGYSYAETSSWIVNTSTVIQGSPTGGNTNYWGIMYFDLTTIKNKWVDYDVSQIVFTIYNKNYTTKATNLYVGGPCPTLSGSPPTSYTISGSKPTAIGSPIIIAAPGSYNPAVFTITKASNQAWINSLMGSSSRCVYINKGDASYYWEGEGAKDPSPPRMVITWTPR